MSWLEIALFAWLLSGLLALVAGWWIASRATGGDFELERNPIAWIPFLLACALAGPLLLLVLLVVTVVGTPLYAVLAAFGFWRVKKTAPQARFLDHGMELFNETGTLERFIEWSDIERVEEAFTPPLVSPQLILRDGERIPLYLVDSGELASVLERHGIPFDRESLPDVVESTSLEARGSDRGL